MIKAGSSTPRVVVETGTQQAEGLKHLLEKGYAVSCVAKAEVADVAALAPAMSSWKPWFPVIDYERCTNCMQCLSFCLFGVYGVDGGQRIQVQNNDNCKTNCPACSRV